MIYFSLPRILSASPYEILLSEGDFLFQTENINEIISDFNKTAELLTNNPE